VCPATGQVADDRLSDPGVGTIARRCAAMSGPRDAPSRRGHGARLVREHAVAVSGYACLTLLLTWPLVRDLGTYVVGEITVDSRHAIWVLWDTTEALFGRAPWPWTPALHYPYGLSLLVDSVGPLNAVPALPFWPAGPAAAYNGAAFVGLTLSGWCMYLLARSVVADRGIAFFAGVLFLAWPFHLTGLYGHVDKLFTGLLPLSVLATLAAADPRRTWMAVLAPALALVGAQLQNGNQFLFAALGTALVGLERLVRADPGLRPAVLRRLGLAGVVAVAACLPFLLAVLTLLRHPLLVMRYGSSTTYYSPDLLHLIVPAAHQWVGAWLYTSPFRLGDFVWPTRLHVLMPSPQWYGSGIETAVAIPMVSIALAVLAWRRAPRESAPWLVFGAAFTVLCLGPWLRAAGLSREELGIPLPYAVMRRVPGLDIMRTPGRFMMMASVGLALAASLGLAALADGAARRRRTIVALATLAVLVECWPRPWPQMALPPVPAFYRRIAAEPPSYAVLDLPHGWLGRHDRASTYLYYQVVHRKPIAWALLSRSYERFPIDGLDVLWSSEVSVPAAEAARQRLRALGYRYVVWHKHADELFAGGHVSLGAIGVPTRPPVDASSDPFLRAAFGNDRPIADDDLVTVFRVGN
jgi:hypothetical protein